MFRQRYVFFACSYSFFWNLLVLVYAPNQGQAFLFPRGTGPRDRAELRLSNMQIYEPRTPPPPIKSTLWPAL